MLLGEVRVVEQAGEKVGGPASHTETILLHHPEDLGRVPDVDQVHRALSRSSGIRKALSIPMKWPTGAPVIWDGPPVGNM